MNIQAIFGPGMVLGFIFFSMLADRKGRKYTYLLALYVMITSIASIYVGILIQNSYLMGLGQFLNGSACMFSLNISFTVAA